MGTFPTKKEDINFDTYKGFLQVILGQEVSATSLKKITLGILSFNLSQRQEVMATSLKKMTLGIWPLLLNSKKIRPGERPLAPPGPFTGD